MEETSKSGGGTLGILAVLVVIVLLLSGGGKGKGVSLSASTSSTSTGSAVVQQIDSVFGQYSAQAETIARCESSLNPAAYNPEPVYVNGVPEHAMGLFQIIPSTFASVNNGTAYKDPYNASDNIQAAYAIFKRDGYSWREWECKPYKQ